MRKTLATIAAACALSAAPAAGQVPVELGYDVTPQGDTIRALNAPDAGLYAQWGPEYISIVRWNDGQTDILYDADADGDVDRAMRYPGPFARQLFAPAIEELRLPAADLAARLHASVPDSTGYSRRWIFDLVPPAPDDAYLFDRGGIGEVTLDHAEVDSSFIAEWALVQRVWDEVMAQKNH